MKKCGYCLNEVTAFDEIAMGFVFSDTMWFCSQCAGGPMNVVASKHARKSRYAKDIEMIRDAKAGFKFGCDPELFVKDDKGRYVSAEGLIPGTKDTPYPVKHGAVQVDGMAAEFNIDPAENFEDFNRNIQAVMGQLKAMLPKGYTLDAVPAVTFDGDVWDASPEHSKELGCMPDMDAWTGQVNPPPHDPVNPHLRTASGHIHIGWTEEADIVNDAQHIMNCRDLVKQLDWYLGGWSVKTDTDPTRRRLYGKAGACRYKSYGVEYRVLSNFWITSRSHRLNVWNRLQTAIDDMRRAVIADQFGELVNQKLISSINESSIDAAIADSFRYPVLSLDTSYRRF